MIKTQDTDTVAQELMHNLVHLRAALPTWPGYSSSQHSA